MARAIMRLFLPPSPGARRPRAALRYGVALAALAAALGLSLLFRPLLTSSPFILFFAAVAVSAWYGGLGAGVLSALVSIALVDYFLVPPFYLPSSDLGDLLRYTVFMFVATLISWLNEARRRAEARAEAQAERFYVTLASIGDAVIATDAAGRITFLNQRAAELTGWHPADAEGRHISEVFRIIDADTRRPAQSPVARVLDEQPAAPVGHTLLLARGGGERSIEDSGAPIRDHSHQIIGVVLVFRDTTERRQAQAALQESRDQMAVILSSVADGIVAQAPGGRLVYANAAAAQAVGYGSVADMLAAAPGEWLQRFEIADEAGQPLTIRELPGWLALQGSEAPAQVVRYRDTATGQTRWSQVQARPVRHVSGQVLMSISIARDITPQKQAEQERAEWLAREQAARAAAEAAVRVRDQFLSLAAHELRTPLTTLTGQVQLFQRRAEREGLLAERDQRSLRIIGDQVGRLSKMALALLDVSRLELGQFSIERAPLDICALVRRVVAEVRPTVEPRQIGLCCPETPVLIEGDDLRLEQVLQNLLQNALKYSAPSAPVAVAVAQDGARVGVAVQDSGIGVPADARPKLFQRFYRAGNAEERHIAGLGIGLYVVREIVTLHGGEVTVESAEGVGSTFTVWLPARDAPPQPASG